jgi:hypothetical protein
MIVAELGYVMLKKLSLGTLSLSCALIVACNDTKFSSGPDAGRKKVTPKAGGLSCALSPSTVGSGEASKLTLTGAVVDNGPIFATVRGDDAAEKLKLVFSNGSYAPEAGGAISFSGKKTGEHTVELRADDSAAAPDATCTFVVDENSNPPGDADISCGFTSKNLMAGSSLDIGIRSSDKYKGEIHQEIKGPVSSSADLKLVDGKWVMTNGATNDVSFAKPGDYEVLLSTAGTAPAGLKVVGCSVKVEASICEDQKRTIGAQVAFIVDNSNSNAATDCPSATKIGEFNGSNNYRCGGQTNREKAVLAAYDILESVSKQVGSAGAAESQVSVASFPTKDSYTDGWKIQSNGWIPASGAANRSALSTSMGFSREPFGLTPYGSGLTAATQLFSTAQDDERSKVLVFVTDGEPTDRNPLGVGEQADMIKASGVEIVTVFITGSATRDQRKADHASMLKRFNDNSIQNGDGPWYSGSISSFDQYIGLINGTSSQLDLVNTMSSKADIKCVDQTGNKCQRMIVEVSDSNGLKSVLENIIKTRAIKCQ